MSILAALLLTIVTPNAALANVPATPASFSAPVDDYPPSDRALCDPVAKPGVLAFQQMMKDANPGVGNGIDNIVRACGGTSDHQEGRAWDWGLQITNASDMVLADEVFTWLIETVGGAPHMRARRLGIRYFIWNNRIYTVNGPTAAWRDYSYVMTNGVRHYCAGEGWTGNDYDRGCHRNHIHFSWSRAGANKLTSWWSGTGTSQQRVPLYWVLSNYNQPSTAAWTTYYSDTSAWPVVGDWEGDGDQTIGVADPEDSWQWYVVPVNSGGSPDPVYGYGSGECTPLTGDWDGDGDDTPGVACANNGQWQWSVVNTRGGSPSATFNYGSTSCTPIVGDWDGIGGDTVGVVCPNGTQWAWSLINVLASGSPTLPTFNYGSANCRPVTGNWDGSATNATDTIGVSCAGSTQWTWYLRNYNSSGGNDVPTFSFGSSNNTRPIVGDWNGDVKTTVGVVTKPNDWT